MAESIITNLVQQLGSLALEEAKSVKEVESNCSSLVDELKIMKSFLRDSEGRETEHDAVKKLLEQIREVTFQAEDVIETFVLETQRHQRRTKTERIVHKLGHWQALRTIAKDVDNVNQRIKNIYENKDKFQIELGEGSRNAHFENLLRKKRMEVDDEVVGFKDVVDTLQKQLMVGSVLEVLSIVGMGGLGKTTVAKKLYNDDKLIGKHFQCIGWVFVSDQDYKTREVLLNLLKSLGRKMDVLEPMETQELKKILRNHLMGLRYLIFLDDVWNKKMWDEVKECFPDKSNGSKIVITSRIGEVARYASPKEPHSLRFLNPEESWLLFCKKVFRGDTCPPHLEPIGRQIATRCKGLPLSIVVLGSMLATKEKSERVWEGTINYVNCFISEDKTCLQLLALSYDHLPLKLKPCFLYFGAFPEDYEMSVRRLIALWLAEGLVQPIGSRPLEDVAESYLEELINRSLVQIGKKRADGGLKTCRIHDLLRDFCIEEANRENLLTANMEAPKSASPSFSQRKHRRVSSLRYTPRLILSKDWDSSSLRALFSFDPQRNSLSSSTWKSVCTKYKLIRILDLGDNIEAGSIPNAMSELTNLSPSYALPFEIFKLQQLEQLIVRGRTTFKANSVRSSTRPLLSLRVMTSIMHNEAFDSLVKNHYFPNLIKLGLDGAQYVWPYFINLLPYVPCLERLTLSRQESAKRDDNDSYEGVDESHILKCNLKKVTLKASSWSGRCIELLGKFPRLQILKLRDVAFHMIGDDYESYERDSISVSENSFSKLHTLHLENIKYLLCISLLHETALLQLRYLFVLGSDIEILSLLQLPNLQDVLMNSSGDENSPSLWVETLKTEAKYRLRTIGGNVHFRSSVNI